MSPLKFVLLIAGGTVCALRFAVPSTPPTTNSSATIESNPLGVS